MGARLNTIIRIVGFLSSLRAYPNSFTARYPIIIAVFASAPGAESELAMVIRPNGRRPIRVEFPGPPAV